MEITQSDAGTSVITVDQMAPFDCDEDEEYVAYIYGADVTFSDAAAGEPDKIADNSANAKTGIKIIEYNL